jgi:hypothetical protein
MLVALFAVAPARADVDPPVAVKPVEAKPALAPAPNLAVARLDLHSFSVVERESGRFSYYRIIEDPVEPFIRAEYRPPLETVVVGIDVGDDLRSTAKRLRWKWRAMALPKEGDECRDGFGDSAAAVYVAWKRFLKIYSLKFVWSSVGKRGQVCGKTRNLFLEQDTIVLETGGPIGSWLEEEIDLLAEFRKHFADGDPEAGVPDFLGIGVMSDGDQTKSLSAGDYTRFAILH